MSGVLLFSVHLIQLCLSDRCVSFVGDQAVWQSAFVCWYFGGVWRAAAKQWMESEFMSIEYRSLHTVTLKFYSFFSVLLTVNTKQVKKSVAYMFISSHLQTYWKDTLRTNVLSRQLEQTQKIDQSCFFFFEIFNS